MVATIRACAPDRPSNAGCCRKDIELGKGPTTDDGCMAKSADASDFFAESSGCSNVA
jgi:hypothetical protein